ncbi:TPA: DUF2857 domain-containing protein [Yersinia enterocolitica]|nr:DUF2857 domain-containing protein [Yersinia aleksiciae]
MFPSLNYSILINVLAALKEGNFRYCEALGFTFDELNALIQLPLNELFIVSRTSALLNKSDLDKSASRH